MTVKSVIRLWPEDGIVVCIEAIDTHHYFSLSNWRCGDEGLIGSGDKIFSFKEESPNFAIRRTNVPCKDASSGKAIASSGFNVPPSTRNLSKSLFVSTAVMLIKFLMAVGVLRGVQARCHRWCRPSRQRQISNRVGQGFEVDAGPDRFNFEGIQGWSNKKSDSRQVTTSQTC